MRSSIPSRVSGAASFAQRAVKGGIAEPVMINPLWSAPARWAGTKGVRVWCSRIIAPQLLAACPKSQRPTTLPLMGGPSESTIRASEYVAAFARVWARAPSSAPRTAPPRGSSIYGTHAANVARAAVRADHRCRDPRRASVARLLLPRLRRGRAIRHAHHRPPSRRIGRKPQPAIVVHALLAASARSGRVASRCNAMTCARCEDTHWVCEEHPDKPMLQRRGRSVPRLQSAERRQGAGAAARLEN